MRKIFQKVKLKLIKKGVMFVEIVQLNFEIIKKCSSDHEAKINDPLLIKQQNPKINKNQLNFFTLKID